MPYQLLADAVLALHFGVVVFVVGGLLAVLVGNGLGWRWVNRRRWRLMHLVAVVVVAAQAWLGVLCPLTTLESWLRAQATAAASCSTGCNKPSISRHRCGCSPWPTPCLVYWCWQPGGSFHHERDECHPETAVHPRLAICAPRAHTAFSLTTAVWQ